MDTAYTTLATGIIEQACADYVWALRYLRKHRNEDFVTKSNAYERHRIARIYKLECEAFIRSEWFKLLSNSNFTPDEWIERLDKISRKKARRKEWMNSDRLH